jgi:flagellar hook-associated protein 2
LNSNFDQVVSFFQDAGSFGSGFTQTLSSLGNNRAAGGAIGLSLSEDSSQESTLNDDISKQESLISTQQTNLTAELNAANEILQSIPQQIQQINEIYSAITGYNRQQNG